MNTDSRGEVNSIIWRQKHNFSSWRRFFQIFDLRLFQEKLADMWTATNMRWEQFVNSEDVEEFVKSNVSDSLYRYLLGNGISPQYGSYVCSLLSINPDICSYTKTRFARILKS